MSARVLLNLSKVWRKSDKMQAVPSILLLFHSKFNKFNNAGAPMLDDPKTTFKSCFCVKTLRSCHLCDVITYVIAWLYQIL